jgi:glycerol-3-phosphate acyltransferase PlsY
MGKAKGIDIRQHGSGNVGATNAFRVLGKSWGIACLVVDALKGALPVLAAMVIGSLTMNELAPWLVGIAAVAGHMFSPFMGFRGGKGVATSLGVMLAIVPLPMLAVMIVGIALIWRSGFVSLGSVLGSALLPLAVLAIHWPQRPWLPFAVTALMGAAVIWKHRANIARLRNGTEKKFFNKPEPGEPRG